MRGVKRVRAGWLLGLTALALASCAAPEPEVTEPEATASAPAPRDLDPPAMPGAFAPDLWSDQDGVLLTWLEPLGEEASDGHRVRFSRLEAESWSEPTTVAEGNNFFANWADFPGVARAADGTLYAHWLAKTAAETYAYSIFLARSTDGGESWQPIGRLNDDDTPTEHGFVSWVREDHGLRAFWLDGREMERGGPMTVRSTRLGGSGGVGTVVWPSVVLDDRVCECCSTDAVSTAEGPLVVYRDRSQEEVRDTFLVSWSADGWSEPRPAATDGWTIEGCPVNGPEVAAQGDLVATSWFTAAEGVPAVRLALSPDGGRTFGEPVVVDGDGPFGRVDLVLDGQGGAIVSWLARSGERAAVRLRRVAESGEMGEPMTIAETAGARASGFPRLVRRNGSLLISWVEVDEGSASRIRLREIPLASVPG